MASFNISVHPLGRLVYFNPTVLLIDCVFTIPRVLGVMPFQFIMFLFPPNVTGSKCSPFRRIFIGSYIHEYLSDTVFLFPWIFIGSQCSCFHEYSSVHNVPISMNLYRLTMFLFPRIFFGAQYSHFHEYTSVHNVPISTTLHWLTMFLFPRIFIGSQCSYFHKSSSVHIVPFSTHLSMKLYPD